MRLSKKHIGRLFDVQGGDGGWAYQLLDIKKGQPLFRAFDGRYWVERTPQNDWRPFKPQLPSKAHIRLAWMSAREIE